MAEGQYGDPSSFPMQYLVYAVVVEKIKVGNLPVIITADDETSFREQLKPYVYHQLLEVISPAFRVIRMK